MNVGTFDRKSEALRAAAVAEGERRGPTSNLAWGDWADRWLEGRTVEASTAAADKSRIENHLRPRWDDVKLSDIRRADVQAWLNRLDCAPTTKKKLGHLLSASLNAAVDAEIISSNPATRLKYPTPDPSPERWLSKDECSKIRAVLSDEHQFIFDLLVGTGMRWGEAIGLHWDFVDLDRKAITVRWSYDRSKLFKAPKSGNKRIIPLGNTLSVSLAKRLETYGVGKPLQAEFQGGTKPTGGLVVGTLSYKPFASSLAAAAAVNGLGHVRIHDLRHTYCSLLVQSGVSLSQVSRLAGHSSTRVTERYADAADAQFGLVRDILG